MSFFHTRKKDSDKGIVYPEIVYYFCGHASYHSTMLRRCWCTLVYGGATPTSNYTRFGAAGPEVVVARGWHNINVDLLSLTFLGLSCVLSSPPHLPLYQEWVMGHNPLHPGSPKPTVMCSSASLGPTFDGLSQSDSDRLAPSF